jgi:hypothetical protein
MNTITGFVVVSGDNGFATGVAVVVALLLIALLVQQEILRIGGAHGNSLRVLNIAIVPLLLSFGFIVGVRIAELLQ